MAEKKECFFSIKSMPGSFGSGAGMTLEHLASRRYGQSLSVQSCFPEIKSVGNSSCNTTREDDASIITFSDDNLSLKDAFSPGPAISHRGRYASSLTANINTSSSFVLRRQQSSPCLTLSCTHDSHLQPPQVFSSSIDFPELEGCDSDIVLSPRMWPRHALVNDTSYTAMEPSANTEADSVSILRAAVTHTNVDFGVTTQNCFTAYVPLHLAALRGDWNLAQEFLVLNPQAVCARITRNLETTLHIAAGAKHTVFVEELVKLMTPDELALRNKVGNTALCFAAASGITKIAEVMVTKNKKLPSFRGSDGATPLCMAALLGHKDMVWYLYKVTCQKDLKEKDFIELLVAAIKADIYDLAIDIIQHHPELALARDGCGETALHVLARKPSAFSSGNQIETLRRLTYSCAHALKVISRKLPKCLGFVTALFETKSTNIRALELVDQLWGQILLLHDSNIGELLRRPSRLLFTAAELGNIEFIILLVRSYPDLIWKVDDHSRSIFHIAVMHRQDKIFNLIHEIGAHKDLIAAYKDEHNNNLLHLAAKLAPPSRLKIDSGAALQLRRELHWFKEVEKVVQPSYKEMKNSEGKTPCTLFSEEHKGLVQEGEKWMKDTASSCMVVAALIATVMFAAAFTVPGGNNNNTGRPIFLHYKSFMVFAISNSLSLFSSSTSILTFLSILTSRYAEEDFLHSLPNRLIIGLVTLFVSIATMMVAFSASLFIVLGRDFVWIAIPVAAVACIPVTLFALLQFPLFADVIGHIYRHSIFFHASNHLLY